MAKVGRKRKGNPVIASKLDNLKFICNNADLSDFFGVSEATVGRFLNGSSSPKATELQRFALKVAAACDGKRLDLTWLLDDSDWRSGPVFIGGIPFQEALSEDGSKSQSQPSKIPESNALRLRAGAEHETRTMSFHVVGQAAAYETGGAMRGGFDDEDLSPFWDDVEIPETTHFVKVQGDSMSPVILGGQYAMIGPEYRHGVHPGERDIVIAEVVSHDEEQAGSDAPWEGVYCKRVIDGDLVWWFESVNPVYPMFSIAKDNCRLWPVIGVWFAGKGKPPRED